jgi:photosystem I subunit 3
MFLKKSIQIFFSFFLSLLFSSVEIASAANGYSNLVPCKESAPFQKRFTTSVKKLETRLKLYEKDTKEYLALVKKIDFTKKRFENYKNSSLLCGKEGLPRIIASGDLAHSSEFIFPAIIFIYIAGWIGWVARKYVQWASLSENSFENEIIINIPIAISMANSGFLWPLDAWKELVSGKLIASQDDISVSPR